MRVFYFVGDYGYCSEQHGDFSLLLLVLQWGTPQIFGRSDSFGSLAHRFVVARMSRDPNKQVKFCGEDDVARGTFQQNNRWDRKPYKKKTDASCHLFDFLGVGDIFVFGKFVFYCLPDNCKTKRHCLIILGVDNFFFFFFFLIVKQEQEIVRPWKLSFSVWTRNQFSDQSRNGKHKTETYPAVRCRPQQTPASWLYAKFWSNPEPVKQRNICSEANQNLENRTKCLFWKNPEPVKQKEM